MLFGPDLEFVAMCFAPDYIGGVLSVGARRSPGRVTGQANACTQRNYTGFSHPDGMTERDYLNEQYRNLIITAR